jgi:hypothetical protein
MADKHPTKNNLYFTNPAIAKEWHQFKNGSMRPTDITLIANRKVWWLCSKDHVWAASINERINGNTCPYCAENKVTEEKPAPKITPSQTKQYLTPKDESPKIKDKTTGSKKILSTENCLQTVNPNLAKEWHPTKNGSLTPKDVTPFSGNQVWWKCSSGHEWKASVSARNSGQDCFYCSYMHKGKR